jgi:hypothetical protein
MKLAWRAVLATLAGMAALAAGCGTTPPSVFYTLRAADPAPAESSSISVIVGPVTLPEAVDRPQLVVSTGGNRVEIAEFHRWAEPLKREIPRVIASQLGRQLGTTSAGTFTDVSISNPDYRVLVDVQRFELRRGEETVVEAVWSVRAQAGATRTGHTRAQERVADASYDAMVAAQRRALTAVSRDIGNALQALQR